MARVNLTAGRIEKLALPEGCGQAFLWDTDAKQLAVRVTAGEKSYIFQSRLNGRSIRMTIGKVADWSIPAARQEARKKQTLIDSGIDPREQKRELLAESEAKKTETTRQSVTLSEAWTAYIEARQRKWSARHKADHEEAADPGGRQAKRGKRITKPGTLAALMPLKMTQIDANCIKAWLRKEAEQRPARARLAFNLLRAFFNWCETEPAYRGIVSADTVDNRIARDNLPKKIPKDDCLQRGQLPAWFSAVSAIANPTIAAYLQILLLTGARRESLSLLKWDDVDFQWKALTIRDKEKSKGGENHTRTIPLTPYVATLLANLKTLNNTPPQKYRILHGKRVENDLESWKPSPWVFASRAAAAGRLTDPTQAHYKACAKAAINGLTLHGLRRSFATLSEWVECPTGIVAQIMGHKPSATAEKHYKVREIDLLNIWHSKIEAWILEQAGIELQQAQAGLREVA